MRPFGGFNDADNFAETASGPFGCYINQIQIIYYKISKWTWLINPPLDPNFSFPLANESPLMYDFREDR